MITAQDIRERTFETSRFNGYDKADVDDFLDELAEEITAAQKESAVLKSKMKVLVEKIEEYRTNEEALNMAVLSAQKLAVQIESEARTRADNMLAEADRQVKAKIGSISELADAEEKRLENAKAATAKFFDAVRTVCNTQLRNIDVLSGNLIPQQEAPKAAEKVSVEDAVRSIEKSVSRIKPEPSMNLDFSNIEEDVTTKKTKRFESTQPFSL